MRPSPAERGPEGSHIVRQFGACQLIGAHVGRASATLKT